MGLLRKLLGGGTGHHEPGKHAAGKHRTDKPKPLPKPARGVAKAWGQRQTPSDNH